MHAWVRALATCAVAAPRRLLLTYLRQSRAQSSLFNRTSRRPKLRTQYGGVTSARPTFADWVKREARATWPTWLTFRPSGPRRRAQPQGGQVSGPRSPIPRDLDSYCTVGACAQPCTGEAMQRRCNVRCRHVNRRHSTPGPGRRRIDSRKSEANPESRDQRRNRRFLLICHRIDRRAGNVAGRGPCCGVDRECDVLNEDRSRTMQRPGST